MLLQDLAYAARTTRRSTAFALTAVLTISLGVGVSTASVLKLVVGHGLRLSAAGIGIGVLLALGLTRLMARLLIGIKSHRSSYFLGIALLFVAIVGLASWLPARRAAALDACAALREE